MSGNESGGGLGSDIISRKHFSSAFPFPDPTDVQEFGQNERSSGLFLDFLLPGAPRNSSQNPYDVLKAFNAWKTDRDAQIAQHKMYLDLVNDRPGRKATVLVPTEKSGQDLLLTGQDIGQGII